jgi:hypothetical protein
VYVLPSGQVQFLESMRYSNPSPEGCNREIPEEFHVELQERNFTQGLARAWSRKGSLPGQLPFHLTHGQKPEPGVPRGVEDSVRTAAWFVRVLADFLETRKKDAGAV